MRPSIFKLLLLFNFFFINSYGQKIIANTCDSTLLTKLEYEKCRTDTAWIADILVNTNYIIDFKTRLLPKYRLIRRNLTITPALQQSLQQLKIIYDTVLNKKLAAFQADMNRKQQYVQPKAYLSSLLSFQVFRFFPDVYAILLHDIHLQLNPKTTVEEKKIYQQNFDKILDLIPVDLYQELTKITTGFAAENAELMRQGFTRIFQGSIGEGYKSKCNIVNFLLWTE